ncbi:MAG: hypothetical protein KatS3mg076_0992 [Candidatus Binatia bacterium]|nr:MAG: hypothetical protein KatS3mg076_0992 [Candidatus Binatia bacterium]
MYALGYLEGLWLQFHDWWVDRPVPADSTHGAFVREDVIADFLSRSLQVWMQWNAKSQRQAIHMLYMHARAPSYFRWDWEQFLMEYITADACWRLARDVWGLKNVPHGGRLHAMCDHWGLEKDTKLLDAFVRLRNELVHQGLWGGRSITGSAFQVYDWEKEFPGERLKPHRAPQWLRHLNVQLIAAVLGYGRPHLPREWWTLTRQYFRSLGEQDEKIR